MREEKIEKIKLNLKNKNQKGKKYFKNLYQIFIEKSKSKRERIKK